jgi:hypothetical protein
MAALQRMRTLLQPDGTQVLRQPWTESSGPTFWPPPETYAAMRTTARAALPGVSFRRLLLWRYALIWTKPACF